MAAPPVLDVYAICIACGSTVERLAIDTLARKELVLTERRELALRADRPSICPLCGGGRIEIRVEERTKRRRRPPE